MTRRLSFTVVKDLPFSELASDPVSDIGVAARKHVIPGAWLATGAGVSTLAVGLLMILNRLTIPLLAPATLTFIMAGLVLAGLRYGLRDTPSRQGQMIRDSAEYVGLFVLVALLGAVASYPVAADSRGFIDPRLEMIDRLLHFNWLGWYELVSAHRSLQLLGSAAYVAIYATPIAIMLYFARTQRKAEARLFLATFWLAAVLTLVLFPHMPARGPLAVVWTGPIPYMPMSALYQSEMIPALRDHSLTVISLGALRGLVCAPSFHTAAAVVYIAAAWPVARLRWPILSINIAMLLATPVEGNHYLADMIGGALVAIAALLAVSVALQIAGPSARGQDAKAPV